MDVVVRSKWVIGVCVSVALTQAVTDGVAVCQSVGKDVFRAVGFWLQH